MNFLPDAPICREDMRLLEEFAAATEVYLAAVKKLQGAQGTSRVARAYEEAETARKQCATAREAIQRHRVTHGCRILGVRPAKGSSIREIS
jgi:hypothetical protein